MVNNVVLADNRLLSFLRKSYMFHLRARAAHCCCNGLGRRPYNFDQGYLLGLAKSLPELFRLAPITLNGNWVKQMPSALPCPGKQEIHVPESPLGKL